MDNFCFTRKIIHLVKKNLTQILFFKQRYEHEKIGNKTTLDTHMMPNTSTMVMVTQKNTRSAVNG